MNFYLVMVYGSLGIVALFISGFWGVIMRQVIPTMLFAVMGMFLLVMGYKANPFKSEEDE